jgi:hypothetical protein
VLRNLLSRPWTLFVESESGRSRSEIKLCQLVTAADWQMEFMSHDACVCER